jgi:hypothetical protein
MAALSASCADGRPGGGLGILSSVTSPSGSPRLSEGSAPITCARGRDLRLG